MLDFIRISATTDLLGITDIFLRPGLFTGNALSFFNVIQTDFRKFPEVCCTKSAQQSVFHFRLVVSHCRKIQFLDDCMIDLFIHFRSSDRLILPVL